MGADRRHLTIQVHFHVIPKPDESQGLGIGWPAQEPSKDALKEYFEQVKAKM